MSEVESKKGRGRPAAKVKLDEEPKKRVSAENGDAPVVKRGRGRPPKKNKKIVDDTEKSGKGRGRPPTKGSPAKKKSDEEEEEDESS